MFTDRHNFFRMFMLRTLCILLLIFAIKSRPPNRNQNPNNDQHQHGGVGQFSNIFSSLLYNQDADADEHVSDDHDDHESEQAIPNQNQEADNQGGHGGGQLTNFFSSLLNNNQDENVIDIDEHYSEEATEHENNEVSHSHEEEEEDETDYIPSFLGANMIKMHN